MVGVLALSACTVVPYEQARPQQGSTPTSSKPAVVESAPQDVLVVPQRPVKREIVSAQKPKSLPAAQRMRQLASAEGEKGDYRRAIALLERALRISPRDPQTYYELGRNHLLMDNPAQALQLAQRGLSLNPNNNLRHQLEQLVDDCKAKLTA